MEFFSANSSVKHPLRNPFVPSGPRNLRETRTLVCGFPAATGAAERGRTLVSEKLGEVKEAIAQLRSTWDLLQGALRYECGSLDECARLLFES